MSAPRPLRQPAGGIAVETVGAPVAVSSLARLLLRLHRRPAHLALLTHDQPRDLLHPQQQRPL